MNCKICNRSLKKFRSFKKINLLKCYVCNHAVSKIKISKKYHKETYSNDYFDEKHKNWMNNPNVDLFEKIYEFILSKKKGSIIDLGCGTGSLCKFLIQKNQKFDITGVDLNKNKKFKKIKFINKEFFSYKTNKKFKFIISLAVIEHVPSIKKYFDYFKKIAKKDAHFIILTINTSSLLYMSANLLFHLGIKKPFERLYDPHHINHFSKESLEKFINKNNFKIIKKINTPISMKQIDYPYENLFTKYFLYISLYILLKLEKFTNRSWLQTVMFKKR
jgi:2-polyprenyl-3-methyl-5-hydroxy-6-metoxy-1,4-benzoquinol methylase